MLMLEQICYCYASPLEEGLNTTSVQNQKKKKKRRDPFNYVMTDERPLFDSWSLPARSKLTLGTMLIPSIWFLFVIVWEKWIGRTRLVLGSVIIPAASRSNIAGPAWVFFSWLSPICWRGSGCWSFVALPTFIHRRGRDLFQTAPQHLIKGWMWKQSLCTTVASRPHLLCFCLWSSQGWRAAVVDFVDSL